jgi:hypothetical protein
VRKHVAHRDGASHAYLTGRALLIFTLMKHDHQRRPLFVLVAGQSAD